MALGNALIFVKQFVFDSKFREVCNSMESKELILKKYDFDEDEFDNAVNMQIVKCQSYEEAESYHQLKQWFAIF